ncbi:restriction endonuclease subunit S [Photorhabdus sp. RW14-46]|nr:restriction endonuclease subunit S [Photorhabdus sp. RW14-46]
MEKLLEGVEVEWKTLGEVGEFIRGNGMQKKDFIETGFPAIHYGQIYTRYGLSADKTFTYISEDLANKLRKANKNDLLLATTSENDEDVVKPLAWLGGEAVISGDMMLFRHDQNVKYLAYYFQTEAFQTQKRKYINGAKVRRVSKDDLAKIVVPIPKKLDIQTEIVRILDAFTELTAKLTAKLTAELTARKKQYSYYRDQLLSFGKGEVEWKALGEVGEFIRGNGMQKKDFIEKGFPAIHYGQIYTRYGLSSDITFTYVSENLAKKLRKANENDLLLATTSENDEDVVKPLAWLGGQVAISGDMILFRNEQNVKYLAYYFQTEAFQAQKRKYITGTKVRRVSKSDLEKILVPIPSLAEQARIVSTLDKFDALTNSISEGLPREIELRQKQYEYYRDLLLNFPKPEVEA